MVSEQHIIKCTVSRAQFLFVNYLLQGDGGDQEFEPTADMLVHDFDDEQTLAEEEALAIAGGEDPQNELNDLKEVSLDYL